MSGRRQKQLGRLMGLASAEAKEKFGEWFKEVCKRPRWERVGFAWRVLRGK